MFMDELTNIDRAMAVDMPFAKFLRSSHRDNRDPHALDTAARNPTAYQRTLTLPNKRSAKEADAQV